MNNSSLTIHLSVPCLNTTDTIWTLHKFIDSVDDLYKHMLNCKTIKLKIKYSQDNCLQSNYGMTFNKILRKRKISKQRRKKGQHHKHTVDPFSPLDATKPNDLKDIKFTKETSQNGALAHSSNLNVGFLGSRASETACTSASTAANEMRTHEDQFDE